MLERSLLTRRIKTLLGKLLYQTALYRAFWRNRALIVVFHRIDDRYKGDPITCSTTDFRAFCDFFQRHFIVVSLSRLVEKLARREEISRHLAITFDDGYLDNHRFAAAELKRRNLPACFFVTTGFVGSRHNVGWDTMRSVESEWMNWEDVRSLRAQGFELAPHTISHVDLGQITGVAAVEEIVGSKTRLEAELGADTTHHFAYPYGGIDHLTEENRRLVRAAGFRSCLSAYGGTVQPSSNPFDLRRTAITPWFVSPYQFAFEVLRGRFQGAPQSLAQATRAATHAPPPG
jgi:peptidoglycan/xylan/chitin deacetylase (PgdA/CDA1 family)